MSHRRGFTLIELLVVIAIVAILAALLFPVYSKMKAAARKTTCICNQRQLFLAFAQYLDAYDERYPIAPCSLLIPGSSSWGYPVPQAKLLPCVNNEDIFFCPNSTREVRNYLIPGTSQRIGTSYNYAAASHPEQITRPSQQFLMVDLWSEQAHTREVPPRSQPGAPKVMVLVMTMFDGHSRSFAQRTTW